MMTVSVSIPKLEPQIRKLADFGRVSDRNVAKMQTGNAQLMQITWRAIAARRTGRYVAGIMAAVRIIPSEILAVAGTSIRSERGFPYPRALEESTRYHYRSTARRGQATAGQVVRAFRGLKPRFEQSAKRTGDQIMKELAV